MNEPIRTQWEIRCAFNAYCKRSLMNEKLVAYRDMKRRQLREVSFSDLTQQEEDQLCTYGTYFANDEAEKSFCVAGKEITAKLLAEALHSLPDVEKPKTQSGIRQIPMSEKVYEALGRVLENRKGAKKITIDGYSNFLFLNRDGCPKTDVNYSNMFRGLVKKYNKCHEETLPKVMTPHTLRHTFCTNLANAGMNPKALQYIMGHSNITMTLNYYAHATFASARAEMERLIAA